MLVVLACIALLMKAQSLKLPVGHVDGAFQTASGLDRLAAGQFPGRDFLPYLGLWVTYLLYPLFTLAGSTLSASGFAAQTMCMVADVVGVVLVCTLVRPGLRVSHAFVVVALLLSAVRTIAAAEVLPPWATNFLLDQLTPGSSLRALRSFAPYLMLLGAWALAARRKVDLATIAGLAALDGFVVWWSNDYGYTTAMLMALFVAYAGLRMGRLNLRTLALYGGIAAATCVATLVIATAFSPMEFLEFNFRGVARDQWWYYGPWTDSARIYTAADFPRMLCWQLALGLATLLFVAATCWRRQTLAPLGLLFLGVALLAGGTIASVGGHIESKYFNALAWWSCATLLAHAASALTDAAALPSRLERLPRVARRIGGLLVLTGLVAGTVGVVIQQRKRLDDPAAFVETPELGGYLPAAWRSYADLMRSDRGPVPVEEYWGIWSAFRHAHPLPVDAVIHALGDQRERAEQHMAAHDERVVTSSRRGGNVWHGWSISANWWFYEPLFRRFVPRDVSPFTTLWEPGAERPSRPLPCTVAQNAVRVATDAPGLIEVTVQYRLARPNRALLFVRNELVRAEDADGWLSLDPKATEATFPALVQQGGGPMSLAMRVSPAAKASGLSIAACSARTLTIDATLAAALPPEIGAAALR